MKFINRFIASIIWIFIFCLYCWAWCLWQESVQITLYLQWQGLIIWTPANLDLWTINQWTTQEYTFSDYFWIEDLKWNKDGHYTTIQCDWFFWPSNYAITWVLFKANDMELIWWIRDNSTIYSTLTQDFTDITSPKVYFYRNTDLNNTWYLNKYWTKPTIKFTIPTDAPTWTYSGKITYTLYDMPVTIN